MMLEANQESAQHILEQMGYSQEDARQYVAQAPAYETNAYYSPSENLICLPAGILQAPLYSPNQSIHQPKSRSNWRNHSP